MHVILKYYLILSLAWCGHCKELSPEFNKAAEIIKSKKLNVVFGDIDATVEQKLAMRFDIHYYPTVIFFIAGLTIHYNSERTS